LGNWHPTTIATAPPTGAALSIWAELCHVELATDHDTIPKATTCVPACDLYLLESIHCAGWTMTVSFPDLDTSVDAFFLHDSERESFYHAISRE
jgi:hypothetical protein